MNHRSFQNLERDREAFVTKGVKLTPMFTGGFALAVLLALLAMAWWREGR